jgi:hypothetical protein
VGVDVRAYLLEALSAMMEIQGWLMRLETATKLLSEN